MMLRFSISHILLWQRGSLSFILATVHSQLYHTVLYYTIPCSSCKEQNANVTKAPLSLIYGFSVNALNIEMPFANVNITTLTLEFGINRLLFS